MDVETLNRLESATDGLSRRRFSPERLAEVRRERGLKQREMADAIDRTLRHYQRIEAGEHDAPASVLGALADTLDVTVDDLFVVEVTP